MFNNLKAIWIHGSANRCRKNEDYMGCIKYAEKTLNLKPSDFLLASAYALKGEAQYHLGMYRNAYDCFKRALETTLNNPTIWTGKNSKRFISEVNTFMRLCNDKQNQKPRKCET